MLKCVCDAKEQARERIIEQEKEKRGWSKLTAARREEVEKIIAADDGMKVLEALHDSVEQAQYGTEAERDELNSLNALLAIAELLFGREKAIA